jgi:xanthine/uracil permease
MSPSLRKFALASHLSLAVGWIGAAVAYLALGIAAETSRDPHTVRGAWVAMEVTGWYVIVPLALATLLSGLVMALGTRWGLFRHYWVVISLALTVFATVVLLLHMPTVSSKANLARGAQAGQVDELGGDLAHPGIGLAVLLVIQVLNVYKPRGMTRYGRRKLDEQRRKNNEEGRPGALVL